MSFADRVTRCQSQVETAMARWLPAANIRPERLHEAMRYACLGPGKRVRPLLVYATADLLNLDPVRMDGIAAAVEMIHAYSLVHDDLPAMDDDDLRRGRPTCHKAFDEATAILAGDALQAYAFEILAKDEALAVSDTARVRMIARLATASGSYGMAGGQGIDLNAQGKRLSETELEDMHRRKTGALIEASILLPLDALDAPATELATALQSYAHAMGLAFQVQDDILDVEGDTTTLGKRSGADAALEKPTYPSIVGMQRAKQLAAELHEDALNALQPCGQSADALRWLADYIVGRKH